LSWSRASFGPRYFVFRNHQPLRHLSQGSRIKGKPGFAAELAREIDQYRLAIAKNDVAVLEDWNLAERIEVGDWRHFVRAGQKIDGRDL
jgi:hypothetical protein